MTSHFSKKWCKKKDDNIPQVIKYAGRGQFDKMVQSLEEVGESVNCTDSHQHSALFYAALNGHKRCLKELLRRGADPNQADEEGLTPCHAVALGGRIPRKLQQKNDKYYSKTGLEFICDEAGLCLDGLCNLMPHSLHDSCCRKRCLEYLVQYGGDLKMYTYQRQETTKDIAKRCGKTSVVRMINEYYALQAKNDSNSAEMLFSPARSTLWMQSISQHAITEQRKERQSQNRSNTTGEVQELDPKDIAKVPAYKEYKSVDGSVWTRGTWTEGVHVTLRQIPDRVRGGGERKVGEGTLPPVMCAEHLLREMDNLRDMHHPHLALLMAVCSGPRQQDMFLVLEPLQTGSLYTMMHKEHVKFSRLEAVGIISDITRAIAYLHNTQGLAHSILSSHAVHLSPKGCGKLCNVFCCQPPGTRLPAVYSPALRLFLPWMAPELIQTRVAALESDIYSLGVLLWEVWSDRAPWPGLSPQQLGRVLIQTGQRLPLTNHHCLIAPILKTCFGASVTRLPAAQLLSQINYIKMTQYKV